MDTNKGVVEVALSKYLNFVANLCIHMGREATKGFAVAISVTKLFLG